MKYHSDNSLVQNVLQLALAISFCTIILKYEILNVYRMLGTNFRNLWSFLKTKLNILFHKQRIHLAF